MAGKHSMVAICLVMFALAGCDSSSAPADDFIVTDVAGQDLPEVDASRLYKYAHSSVDADSLVRVLLAAPLGLAEAWQPLEDLCEDALGPRFTVVLTAPDPRIETYGFEPGNGIRACTRLVRRYVPTR